MASWLTGRISTNIRRVIDLLRHCENQKIDAVLFNLDFIKCFDSISFDSILGSLDYFRFPPYIQEWVQILYTDFTLRVQNNGKFTPQIPVERSVHQGGCVSVQLFLLCAETIALEIRQAEGIKGISIEDIEYLLNQYADDTSVASLLEEGSVKKILHTLEICRENTGFAINYDKSAVIRLGPCRDSDAKYYTQKDIAWTSADFTVLGIIVSTSDADMVNKNYAPLLDKITATLHQWKNRNLSLMGKITVINSLVASLFVYKMAVLPAISEELCRKLDSILSRFIWNDRRAKISTKMLQYTKKCGGLGLINFQKRDMAIKTTWIQTLSADEKMSNLAFSFFKHNLKDDVWNCNISPASAGRLVRNNAFWVDVLTAWLEYSSTKMASKASRFLWFNELIKINGEVVWWEECYRRGLRFPDQLCENGQILSLDKLSELFGLSPIKANSLVSAIPSLWIKEAKSGACTRNPCLERSLTNKKLASTVYSELCTNSAALTNRCNFWMDLLDCYLEVDEFCSVINNVYKVTNIPKLRSFQYRLLHNSLVFNAHLYRWGLRDNNLCSFCEREKETMIHCLVKCNLVQDLWCRVEHFVNNYSKDNATFDPTGILFNQVVRRKPKHIKNFVVLVTKQYIYKQKCLNLPLNFTDLKHCVWSLQNKERYIAVKNNHLDKYLLKWGAEPPKT